MSGFASDISINNTGHTYGTTYGISGIWRYLADDNSGVLASGGGVGRNGNSERYFGGTIWRNSAGSSGESNPICNLRIIRNSGKIGGIVLPDDIVWGNGSLISDIGRSARRIGDGDNAGISLSRCE